MSCCYLHDLDLDINNGYAYRIFVSLMVQFIIDAFCVSRELSPDITKIDITNIDLYIFLFMREGEMEQTADNKTQVIILTAIHSIDSVTH
jgi:hypothetical protein